MQSINQTTPADGTLLIHWFGQSSYCIKDSRGTVVMVDPYFPHDRPSEKFIHAEPPVDETDVETHFVLLTHNHRDHTCVESIGRITRAWPDVQCVGPVESIESLVDSGVDQEKTSVIKAGERTRIGTMTATAVYAKPPAGDPAAGIDSPDVTHLGYVVDAGGVRLYFSGDPINTFAEHDELIQPIKALHPHIGFLTTHPVEGEFPFFDGSVATARKLGLQTAVPAHYDCFVKRTYDPREWAAGFGADDACEPLVIPYNTSVEYSL